MANIETKFSIGDKVYRAYLGTETKRLPCPDCMEHKKWSVTSPGGHEYTFPCPRCSQNYGPKDGLRLTYEQFVAKSEPLTIGSVRLDTNDKENPVSYMCVETGVGSGSVYYEKLLFSTRDEAIAAAEAMATEANKNTTWVKESYDKAVSVCEYQLDDARLKIDRQQVAAQISTLRWFVEDVRTASNLDEIEKLVEKFDKLAEAA